MKYNKSFLSKLPLFTVLCISAHSIADDTEIYFDLTQVDDPNAFKPNVLFILDTSGSMTGTVTTILNDYDPSTSYGSSDPDKVYFYRTSLVYTSDSVQKTSINCDAMLTALQTEPKFISRVAQWRGSTLRWRSISSSNTTSVVECEADSGTHGSSSTPTPNVYASNSGQYSALQSNEIDWGSRNNRLAVTANYHDFLQSPNVETDTKTNVMKAAAVNLVNNFTGLNLGLMRFDTNGQGGYVVHHFSDIETDKTNIISAINSGS